MNTAQNIANQAKNAAHAEDLAFDQDDVQIEQDWDNETTIYFFSDGSKLFCSGPEFLAQ